MEEITCQTYIVEDGVEFSPHEHTLYSKLNGSKVTLLASASECFLCLLENHGKLVTKKELVHIGWEQYNLHVSDSTFNQNIFTLRKALKDCGLTHEIIRTVPRKGLLVPKTINITLPATNVEPIDYIFSSDNSVEVHRTLSTLSSRKSKFNSHLKTKLQLNLFIIILVIACTGGIVTGIYVTLPTSYISNYKDISEAGGCNVNIDILRSTLTDYKKFISSYDLHCKKNEHIYFSTYQYVPRISVLRCRYDFRQHHRNECVSWYFLDKKI
ncbi:winged helix-turn-helix domain-containing protein [Klebsiella aerogenes]|nr:winged helix-turn-helix domain-containing protein [Klebsiella aerogenes]ELJ2007718.1 winged helix-turn-helix domain-containing protein [Klebsiella aerogenes]